MKRMLLADDDVDDRMLFEEVFAGLPSAEYSLWSVVNGEEVIFLLKDIPDKRMLPDVIVLDQNMPVRTGRDTLEYLKASDSFKHIPVIIYSTYNDPLFVEDCLQLGASAVLSKPDSYDGYLLMVRQMLGDVDAFSKNKEGPVFTRPSH